MSKTTREENMEIIDSLLNEMHDDDSKSAIDTRTEEEKAERYKKQSEKADKIFMIIMLCLTILVVCYKVFLNPVRVVGDSMVPTYEDGQLLITTRNVKPETVHYDSIVVFKGAETSNSYYIKRVVGLPGDTLVIRDGILYINGIAEDRQFHQIINPGKLSEELTLGQDEYFVMGDNRNNSNDSRSFGPIKLDEVNFLVLRAIF